MHIVILRCVMRGTAVLSAGIIFSFHAGVLVCPIICPVNPAEPKTTTQYASKSLLGPRFSFISVVGRKSLGDTEGRTKIPRCTSSKLRVVQGAARNIGMRILRTGKESVYEG